MLSPSPLKTIGVSKKQFRALALPVEHGIWGFWLEPSLLALLVVPTRAGLCLALAVLATILAQHPFIVYLNDVKLGKHYPRTRLTFGLTMIYAFIALLLLSLSIFLAKSVMYLSPLLMVSPFILYQFQARLKHNGRHLLPELLGAASLSTIAPSLLLLGDINLDVALAVWLILLARTLPSILYVRARLRLGRGEPIHHWPSLLSAGLAVALALGLVRLELMPTPVAIYFLTLFIRTAFGLSSLRFPLKAKHIGMLELLFGFLLIFSIWFKG